MSTEGGEFGLSLCSWPLVMLLMQVMGYLSDQEIRFLGTTTT